MNTQASVATGRAWPRRLVKLGIWLLGIAVLVLILDGPLYRLQILPLGPALLGMVLMVGLSLLSFLLLLIGVLASRSQQPPLGWMPVVALVVAGALALNFALLTKRAFGVPPIHEVSTDLDDPPDFSEVVALREQTGARNPPEYVRQAPGRNGTIDVPAAQRRAYPDLQTARLPVPPAIAFENAERAAREMGWEIVAVVPAEGRIEATDTTFYYGFKDDIAIRVRADGANSKIDVRSKSRIGMGDVGANAARVRAYLARLK